MGEKRRSLGGSIMDLIYATGTDEVRAELDAEGFIPEVTPVAVGLPPAAEESEDQ